MSTLATLPIPDKLRAYVDEALQEVGNDPFKRQSIVQAAEMMTRAVSHLPLDPTIFIGIPHLFNVELGCAKGCLVQCSRKMQCVYFEDFASSLLAWGFNHLWCMSLNSRRHKYWLLHHADIAHRTPFFLDVLIEELERGGWDALHVPMPIKDDRNLTSTGLGNGNDKWARVRRITRYELQKLPPVFGLDEVIEVFKKTGGHIPEAPVFCPNTGVLLVRQDRAWAWEFPGFTIQDKLTTEIGPEGVVYRRPYVVPEDWNFGFWMQANGLKVGGCRRIRSNHYSTMFYGNDVSAGDERDEDYCSDPSHW